MEEVISLKGVFAKQFVACVLIAIFLLPVTPAWADKQPRIQVMGMFRDKAIVKINGQQTMLKVGDEPVNGVKLIRSSARKTVLEFNGKQREYTLGSQVSTNLSQPDSAIVRIPSNQGMYKTQGLINGRSVHFMVDTGASVVAMARPTADRLQILYRETGKPIKISTASRLHNAWLVKLDSVTVGGITLHQVEGAVIDTELVQNILLGASFLNRVKFSQEEGIVVLEALTQ